MQEIESLFRQAFEDRLFTRSERQQVRQALTEEALTEHELAVLRSKIFDMVRADLHATDRDKLLDWLEEANKLLLPDTEPGSLESEVFFSPGEECLRAICARLQHARQQADICVFTISDNRITDEIVFAHSRGVQVRIITDNDKLYDEGSDIRRLQREGISVRVDHDEHHMHHKFALMDQAYLLTGSYNWTRSAAAYNMENLLVSNDRQTVRRYRQEFERLWERMKPF